VELQSSQPLSWGGVQVMFRYKSRYKTNRNLEKPIFGLFDIAVRCTRSARCGLGAR
jgi:hypothetical protein